MPGNYIQIFLIFILAGRKMRREEYGELRSDAAQAGLDINPEQLQHR